MKVFSAAMFALTAGPLLVFGVSVCLGSVLFAVHPALLDGVTRLVQADVPAGALKRALMGALGWPGSGVPLWIGAFVLLVDAGRWRLRD